MEAEVTRAGALDMQVCVPQNWTNEQVVKFAEEINPCGTFHGWTIREEGDKALKGYPERIQCEQREDFVHIMLDA